MPTGRGYDRMTVDQAARRVIRRHLDELTTVAFVLVLLHCAAFAPLFLSQDVGSYLPTWLCWVLVALVYIFTVMPARYWGREKVRRLFYTRNLPSRAHNPYFRWMKTGLLRLFRACLWGLPFIAGMAYLLIGKSTVNYTDMLQPIMNLARLVGQEPNIGTGLPIALVLLVLFGLLFAYGWWRDLPFEYLPVRSLGRKHTLHWSRRILKAHRKDMVKVTAVNALLCLPAVIGVLAVMIPYVLSKVDFSLSKDIVLNLVLRLLKTPLPVSQFMGLGFTALILYLPLCGYRKIRQAALIAKLMRVTNPHHSHQEAPPTPDEEAEEEQSADGEQA